MKKLHSLAFYALATPVLTLGAGSVLAQQSGQDIYGQQDAQRDQSVTQPAPKTSQSDQSKQREQGAMQSTPSTSQSDQSKQREHDAARSPLVTEGDKSNKAAGKSDPKSAADKSSISGQSDPKAASAHQSVSDQRKQNTGFMSSAPAKGMHTNNLIGAEVKTVAGENVGPVNDLLIDEDGQVVAIIVSVGGFLGMGEREVAIGWDDVTKTGSSDDLELQIDATRQKLTDAPEFKKQK